MRIKIFSYVICVLMVANILVIEVPKGVNAQVTEEWIARYDDLRNGPDDAMAMAIGPSGNIYVTGRSGSDWTNTDILTIAYDPSGHELWISRYDGTGNGEDYSLAIAVDSSEIVYVTGGSTNNMMNLDYTTIAYDSSGTELWVATYDGPAKSNDIACAIAADNYGNVYITGGSHNFISETSVEFDIATVAYDSFGNELWVATYNGPGNHQDVGRDIALDSQGNIYITGESKNNANHDYITIVYDSSGNILWLSRYDGPSKFYDQANALILGNSGNVYVTGQSWTHGNNFDYATIAYNTKGKELWVARYDGPGNAHDEGLDIVIDPFENIYVTGRSSKDGLNFDYFTIGYDKKGNERWTKRYNGPGNGYDAALSMAIDSSNNIYVTGQSRGNGTYFDYATIAYDSFGNELWIARYNGVGNRDDVPSAIVVDSSHNVYITGNSWGGMTHYDYTTVKYTHEVPFKISIDINPNTLNLKSKGTWITCHINLPTGYDINDIDISSIMLEDTIAAEWGNIQGETLMVKFDRSEVKNMLSPGTYNLKVTGELVDGTVFEGYSDEIQVIDPGK